jgi:hypothetical protein
MVSTTVYFEGRRRRIVEACEKKWPELKDDCSGFVKAVFKEIGASADLPDKKASALYDYFLQTKKDWFYIGTGANAVTLAGVSAHEGNFVVAAWKNPDTEKSGHLAVVTEFMSTADAVKPEQQLLAYWGTLNAEGKKNEKITLSFGSDKLKDLSYFVYQGDFSQ